MAIKLFALLIGLTLGGSFTPGNVMKFWSNSLSKRYLVIDPTNKLSGNTQAKIQSILHEKIENSRSFFVLLDSISKEYQDSKTGSVRIDDFTDDLIELMIPEKEFRDFSLLAVYSLSDRVYKVRVGREIRKRLSDADLKRITDDIKPLLKKGELETAFLSLFEKLAEEYNSKMDASTLVMIVFGLVALFILIKWIFDKKNVSGNFNENTNSNSARSRGPTPYFPEQNQENSNGFATGARLVTNVMGAFTSYGMTSDQFKPPQEQKKEEKSFGFWDNVSRDDSADMNRPWKGVTKGGYTTVPSNDRGGASGSWDSRDKQKTELTGGAYGSWNTVEAKPPQKPTGGAIGSWGNSSTSDQQKKSTGGATGSWGNTSAVDQQKKSGGATGSWEQKDEKNVRKRTEGAGGVSGGWKADEGEGSASGNW